MNINSISNKVKKVNLMSFRARLTVEIKGRKHVSEER